METDTAVEHIDDARLLALLRADAPRFPDAAVEEIGRRGDRLIPGLLDALRAVDGRPLAAVQAALGAIGRPARIHFVQLLPKTRSGKLLRRSIQALAEGRDPGDLTTLEDPTALDQIRSAVTPPSPRPLPPGEREPQR